MGFTTWPEDANVPPEWSMQVMCKEHFASRTPGRRSDLRFRQFAIVLPSNKGDTAGRVDEQYNNVNCCGPLEGWLNPDEMQQQEANHCKRWNHTDAR